MTTINNNGLAKLLQVGLVALCVFGFSACKNNPLTDSDDHREVNNDNNNSSNNFGDIGDGFGQVTFGKSSK